MATFVNDDESKQRLLIAGAHAYAKAFSRVPPSTKLALENELAGDDELPNDVKNAVTAALWSHPYDEFVAAVRRALVKAV